MMFHDKVVSHVDCAGELANEPHTSDHYESNRGLKPGVLVNGWLCQLSSYVKSLDPKHLVRLASAFTPRSHNPATSACLAPLNSLISSIRCVLASHSLVNRMENGYLSAAKGGVMLSTCRRVHGVSMATFCGEMCLTSAICAKGNTLYFAASQDPFASG